MKFVPIFSLVFVLRVQAVRIPALPYFPRNYGGFSTLSAEDDSPGGSTDLNAPLVDSDVESYPIFDISEEEHEEPSSPTEFIQLYGRDDALYAAHLKGYRGQQYEPLIQSGASITSKRTIDLLDSWIIEGDNSALIKVLSKTDFEISENDLVDKYRLIAAEGKTTAFHVFYAYKRLPEDIFMHRIVLDAATRDYHSFIEMIVQRKIINREQIERDIFRTACLNGAMKIVSFLVNFLPVRSIDTPLAESLLLNPHGIKVLNYLIVKNVQFASELYPMVFTKGLLMRNSDFAASIIGRMNQEQKLVCLRLAMDEHHLQLVYALLGSQTFPEERDMWQAIKLGSAPLVEAFWNVGVAITDEMICSSSKSFAKKLRRIRGDICSGSLCFCF